VWTLRALARHGVRGREERSGSTRRIEQRDLLVGEAANAAAEQAATEKARVQAQAEELIASTRSLLTETQEMVEKAPKGKGSQADIAALKADLAAAETSLADAEASVAAGKYKEAVAKAESVQQNVLGVKTAVEEAMAAKGGR
jgi:hypothetical protein